jgi:hypothetical protein
LANQSHHRPATDALPEPLSTPTATNSVPPDLPIGVRDRRSEARYPAQEPAELEIMFGDGTPIYGTILDISRSGLKIALPKRISRGEQVKVKFNRNVIFGEVRYCRAVSPVFYAGIRIQDLVRPAGKNEHLAEDALALYAAGKGLSVSEVIEIREHLGGCESCRARVAEREALLSPSRRRRLAPRTD